MELFYELKIWRGLGGVLESCSKVFGFLNDFTHRGTARTPILLIYAAPAERMFLSEAVQCIRL